ncbi:two-component regulator propeller domain-containing protein [Bacteroides thetaiotaomicron]|jgi:signal transduction histidine kinase/ligand-binding sensor domain-containing protein/DNA-binding response OmpR family regulator|uniref:histidine kinase n=1 Tax=Bacteroides thetaiotaomicron TaxID=818 RepID=A0A414HPJ8_BACT4|nr:two-component regulator propeller domain-containing protein [Bacteroides thetaiotaomicron]MCI8951799.1 response regulator [Bacteroides thetaiotaomicron]MCS3366308.1 response regulator [Bacteroides thetaiotaomicron]RGQ44105.1 hybrid sensor histidine kinase/response regulator [Bacteroides thetaiotaomicron]RHD88992.1 hybrid sensor histidine kinase/response regulator [Bacteroides thetaiotaomicron]
MSKLKKIVIYLFFLCLGMHSAFSETPEQITFSYISINEGLSQSTVFSIDQDKRGNMWFATYDGVNKYDGYAFTVYQHNEDDPNSIANDISRIVKTDSQGRVWIGTRDGLSRYDEEKDIFQNFFYEKNGKHLQVNGIEEISPEQLLISTPEGLIMFDIKESKFIDDSFSTAMHKTIASTLYRQDDQIYIGTSTDGLYTYSITQKTFEKVIPILGTKQIQAILQQSPTRIWVATEGAGLFLINPKTKEIKNYLHSPSNPKSISSNYIRSLAMDSQNRLWIGTFNDLNIYHEGTDSFASYSSNPVENGSLSQRSVRSIFMDSQGGMWLGTYFGGLNYYHPIRNRFKNIRNIPYKNSLSDNVVSCIVEDKDKNLWIGTNDGGLNLYNPITQRFTSYTLQEDESARGIGSNNIKAVYVDEKKSLVYIGTHAGGLSILHRNSGQVENFNQRNSQLVNENVYAILPDGEGNLWLGTLSALVRFNPEQRSFTTIEKEKDGTPVVSKQITTLFRDSHKRLWIGGEEGLSVFKQEGLDIQKASILPVSNVTKLFTNCIYEASNGVIWVGTREGFYCFNEKDKQIKRYNTTNGLPNNVVYGILEDSFGRLWLSTNRGISCFNPETEKFRNFTESDGLQSNQFNTASYCRTSVGQMYFGGINGITTFRPELLLDNPYTPPVVITKLQLFNKVVRPDDETGILTKNISETKSITLKSWQTAFSIEFVVSNYISGQHNTFAYKLEGYDKEWYYLTDSRTVSYSNLPQGTYQFLVKAANSDGKWNPIPTALEIIVLPIWYKTWWALLIFFATFAGFITFVFRFFWMRKSMEAQLEIERRDKEHQEEINQMKMRFFINISHELRTPLTLILTPLQEIINKISDRWTRNQLEYIQRNANRLLHLVNQLMDYRRAELGVFELKAKKGNAHQLIQDNFLFYDKLARHKKITYTLHSELEDKEVLFDANYLELIVNNLLSNAFKYTESGQSITVTLKEENGWLLLQVSDTGIGIPINKQGKIFERFYQIESEHVGSGIGLSLVQRLIELHHGRIELDSEENKGSTFSVYLPQDLSVYKPSELASNDEQNEEEQVYSTNSKAMYFIDTEKVENESVESGDKKRGTILIVEDNNEIRRYLSNGLADLFNTLEAGNGEEALEKLKDNEVDVIVTDVMMPVMDGIKLCKNVKQNIRTCHIPVIILSAKTDIKDQMEGLQMGADDYIPKPFSLAILTTKIQNMMRTRRRMLDKYAKSLEVEPEKITFNAMDEALLKRAMAIVEKNMDNIEFSTDEFAREMNMSRSNLHLKLKAITGESTIDFIRKIRFNEAAKLLKDGRYTVAEVSTMVGFNTPSYFATSFKKYFGCLPTEYIKKSKG